MAMVDFGPAMQRLADFIARTTDEELGRPTPCPSYTLGDLIAHVGGMAVAFAVIGTRHSRAAGRLRWWDWLPGAAGGGLRGR